LIAFDTNLLIYAEIPEGLDGRHERAARILTKLAHRQAVAPIQVLGEFINVCRKKRLVPLELAMQKVANYALMFETPQTELADIANAASISARHDLQFFDALIVTISARAGADVLLSEDMQNGQIIGDLRILNPFNPANLTEIDALLA
jgi:predicted nucleic acid-binding protein